MRTHLEPYRIKMVEPLPGQAIACALFLQAGVRATEVGQLMRGRPGPDGCEPVVPVDLVRLAIPRRVYTRNHLEYAAEAVIEVFGARERLQPLEIVEQPSTLRHFTARLRPRSSPVAAREYEALLARA